MTSAQGVSGAEGDGLLAAGLESSRSHGNADKGVEKVSDWSDGWRWGVLLCCCRGNEAVPTSENWSCCWSEDSRKDKAKRRVWALTGCQTRNNISRIYKQGRGLKLFHFDLNSILPKNDSLLLCSWCFLRINLTLYSLTTYLWLWQTLSEQKKECLPHSFLSER